MYILSTNTYKKPLNQIPLPHLFVWIPFLQGVHDTEIKLSRGDAHYKAHCYTVGNVGRTSIGYERQRYSHNRHQTDVHADVDEEMEKEHSDYSGTNVWAENIACASCRYDYTQYDDQKADENHKTAYKADFLRQDAEYEVCTLLRNEF